MKIKKARIPRSTLYRIRKKYAANVKQYGR